MHTIEIINMHRGLCDTIYTYTDMSHSISVDRSAEIQPDYGYTAGADYLFEIDLKTQALELLEKFKHPSDSEEREETRVSTLKNDIIWGIFLHWLLVAVFTNMV